LRLVGRWFLALLGITAAAAVIALLFPGAVALGFIMGVLPGIFLGSAPSLLIYLVAWWAVRWIVLRVQAFAGFNPAVPLSTRLANLVALVIVAIPAITIPLVANAPLQQQIAMLQATDVQPAGSLKLPAIVAVELPKSHEDKAPYCEAICLRLLYNGVVSRVIAAEILRDGKVGPATSYRIERRDECPKPEFSPQSIVWPGEWRSERGKAPIGMEDRVRARIAAGECLVREAGHLEDAEIVISLRGIRRGLDRFDGPWKLQLDTLSARRLEIVESNGRVLFRRTEVTTEPLAIPMRHVVVAALLTTVTYSGWVRSNAEASPLGPNARDILPGLLGEASRPPDLPDTSHPH
jgi:hypothetical protein